MSSRKKPSKSSTDKTGKPKWSGFVKVYLTPAEKKQIKAELMQEDHVLQFIDDMAKGGYKVSVSYSEAGNFYSVTAYGNTLDNVNAGWAMTLRHSDLQTAFTALAFSHEYKGIMGDWEGKYGEEGELNW